MPGKDASHIVCSDWELSCSCFCFSWLHVLSLLTQPSRGGADAHVKDHPSKLTHSTVIQCDPQSRLLALPKYRPAQLTRA